MKESGEESPEPPSEDLSKFNGLKISEIKFDGLVRTRESAARWLLTQFEGEKFDSDTWREGIHNLYNTWVLYDLTTEVTPVGQDQISLTIHLKDKWTLYPFFFVQTGGGLNSYGGGLLDFNFLGIFTNAAFTAESINGTFGYDLNFFQQWIGHSDYMASFDLSDTINPTSNVNGDPTISFTWRRIQKQVMFGKRFGTDFRTFLFFELFQDSLLDESSTHLTYVYRGVQYHLRPSLVWGRVNFSNYLEEGHEITLMPTFVNPTNSKQSKIQLSLTAKKVWVVRKVDNAAVFFSTSWVSNVPLPYQLHLGGFDSVRGYTAYRRLGIADFYTNIEYRPLLFTTRIKFLDTDLLVLQGNIFTDFGGIQSRTKDILAGNTQFETLWSAGLGGRFFLVKYAGAIGRLDFARTISPNEGWAASLGVTQFF
jgi:outer membrane protein assembly factor BamA